jgi:hypothetical protein
MVGIARLLRAGSSFLKRGAARVVAGIIIYPPACGVCDATADAPMAQKIIWEA